MERGFNKYEPLSRESIWEDKRSFRDGSALTKLIYINLGVFIVIKLVTVISFLIGNININHSLLKYLGVPADPKSLFHTPWGIVTYMFTHFGGFHILFNLLWLYWFGSIFRNYFSDRRLTGIYLLGGACGAIFYMFVYSIFPSFAAVRSQSWAVGASASIMAIVFAVCTYLPNHKIYIFLLGPVKLIHLALFTVLIDIISIPTGNAGGHIAHLGGAFFGYLFTLGEKQNIDITAWFTTFFTRLYATFFKPKKR